MWYSYVILYPLITVFMLRKEHTARMFENTMHEKEVHYTRQQNFTFFLAHKGKYQILIELLTLNSNM